MLADASPGATRKTDASPAMLVARFCSSAYTAEASSEKSRRLPVPVIPEAPLVEWQLFGVPAPQLEVASIWVKRLVKLASRPGGHTANAGAASTAVASVAPASSTIVPPPPPASVAAEPPDVPSPSKAGPAGDPLSQPPERRASAIAR